MVSPAVRAGIEKRLKESGLRPLNDSQKEALQEQRTLFLKQGESLDAQIAALKQQIGVLKEKKYEDLPAIPGAEYVHGKYPYQCGMKAAIYYTTTPQGGAAGGDYVYYCLFCDKEFM